MAFVLSPSNMGTWRQCPRKFQAQSITKELKWQASAAKSRGELIHSCMEKALREGPQAVTNWPQGMDYAYTQEQLRFYHYFKNVAPLHIEHELVVNSKLKPAEGGWWDDDAYLRARADAIFLPRKDDKDRTVILLDFKSGKIWDREGFQLRVEALLAHLIYQVPLVKWQYLYVDQGESVEGWIDFRQGLGPVSDIIRIMRDIHTSIKNNYFPTQKNNLCKWCGLYKTTACGD